MHEIKSSVMGLVSSGNLSEAKRVCLKACNSEPENAEMWFILSAICGQQNDFEGAERYCRRVLKLNPNNSATYYNLAIAQRRLGEIKKAISTHQQAINLQPDFIPSIFELGNIYMELENYDKAIEFYDATIEKQPNAFQAHTARATALFKSGHLTASTDGYLVSLAVNPGQPDAYIGLATIYENNEEYDKAIESNNQAVIHGCDSDDVYINLGRLYVLNSDFDNAERQYKKLLSVDASNIEALTGLALLYDDLHKNVEALDLIERAASIVKNDERVYYNHAKILTSNNRFLEAEALYKKSLEIKPEFVEALINLGNIYLLSGRAMDAYRMYKSAYDIHPDNHDAASNMLMSLNYTDVVSARDCVLLHETWAKNLNTNRHTLSANIEDRPKNKKLRVGYISPDLRKHSVAYFFDAILRYSNSDQIKNHCYSDVRVGDAVTETLKSLADDWVDVFNLTDEALARKISEDNIDILIDLVGHMSANRLRVFNMKPAPVQVTYLGYPNTTGLETIDYRIVDHYTDPEDMVIDIPEKRLYLDQTFLCYRPIDDCPDVTNLPASVNGYTTFGSFNNLAKITDKVLDTWSELLNSVPNSRLCLKARQFADTAMRDEYVRQFEARGVSAERLQLMHYSNTVSEHLECYSNIDIALDTFPYNGTTTTYEALWMGVPVITLAGENHVARVGVSILSNIDRTDWIASTTDEYVEIARKMALDISALTDTRKTIRNIMKSSPLCDGMSFVEKYESTLLSVHGS